MQGGGERSVDEKGGAKEKKRGGWGVQGGDVKYHLLLPGERNASYPLVMYFKRKKKIRRARSWIGSERMVEREAFCLVLKGLGNQEVLKPTKWVPRKPGRWWGPRGGGGGTLGETG